MISFEVGKSYRTFNNKTYTVTKRTEAFVTFTNASGTKTFRRKPYEHSDGYEWTEGPNIGGYRISAVEEVKEQSEATPAVVSMQPDVQPEEIAAPKADATCNSDVQEASVIVDDIPADHEPDVQEVKPAPVQEASATTYEAMREAYEAYLDSEDKYLTSRKTDTVEKAKSDEAFRQYLTLLGRYRQEGMPKREEALNWIREYCEGKLFPVDSLKGRNLDELIELAHKCGIHEALFSECDSRGDLAIKLAREAGIKVNDKTFHEWWSEKRKELQAEIHKLWQKRHALRKAQRVFGEGSSDAEALSDVWDQYQDHVDVLLGEYWSACESLSRSREKDSRYEANSQLADTLAKEDMVVRNEPEVQTSRPEISPVLKKGSRKTSRKSHTPSWVQSPQLDSKTSRHEATSKPLLKVTKAASAVRIRKL